MRPMKPGGTRKPLSCAVTLGVPSAGATYEKASKSARLRCCDSDEVASS